MADGRVIIEAILDTANVSKNVKRLGKELGGVSWKNIAEGDKKAQALSGAFKDAGTACSLSLTTPIIAAGAAAFGVASDYQQATSQIQAAFGLTREEAERFKDVGANIYEGGWGQSMDDVTTALMTVKENFKDLDDVELQSVTESALMLRDTMDMDVSESIRGAENLSTAFGLTGEQSMDLITKAAQNGLNSTDELGDNLAEYATLFQENGYSADEMFSTLQAGLDAGAYNLDKVNDLVKEFGIRMSDGTVGKACEDLGGNFKTMFDDMTASGASNKEIFSALAGEISTLGTEQEKAAAISAIFGSQGEDNGTKVIEAMAGVTDAYGDVEGAANAAKEAASDNFANQAASAMRTLLGSLEPLGEPLVNIATKVAEVVRGFGEWFAGIGESGQTAVLVIAGIVAAIGPMLSVAGSLVTIIPAITGLLGGAGAAAGAAGVGTGALGGALSALMGPVGIVIGVIAALIAAFVYLWNTNEGFRNAVMDAWNSIMTTVQTIIDQLRPYIEQAWAAIQNAVTTAMNVIMPIVAGAFQFILAVVVPVLQSILETVGSVFMSILSTVTGVMDGLSSIIGGVWDVISGIVQTVVGFIQGVVTGDFSMMQAGISQIMDGILGIITGIWNTISSVIDGVINTIGSIISGGLDAARASVEGVFNGIKGIIDNVMGDAENVVSGALDAIAGFFRGLRIEWPHIPVPQLTISGSFNLDPFNFSVPSIGLKWYAKGGVFNGASVIGVGEAGPEAVVPLSGSRMRPFADAIAKNIGSDTGGTISITIEKFIHTGSEVDDEALLRRIAQQVQRKRRAGGFA